MPKSKPEIIRTGGAWDPSARPLYFGASDVGTHIASACLHNYILIPINAMKSPLDKTAVSGFVFDGQSVLIDSGVFELSTRHAAKNDMTMAEALSLAPDEIDGFKPLFEAYVKILQEIGAEVWGYIEIDQGGQVNKNKTRARLEEMGLRPIPVYHPLNDEWDHFDFLAQRYDRVCVGNLVQAEPALRKRLVATIWERRRRYPHLWVHLLGVTPSELTAAYPLDSCDSSTWMSGIRWGTHDAKIANKRAWPLGSGFSYDLEANRDAPRGHRQAVRLAAYDAAMVSRTMQVMKQDQERALGADTRMTILKGTK